MNGLFRAGTYEIFAAAVDKDNNYLIGRPGRQIEIKYAYQW